MNKYLSILVLFSLLSCQTISSEFKYIDFQGAKIYYERIDGGEENLLFIHGWGCDHEVWKYQKEYFKNKANLIFIDLPGYGKSSKVYKHYNIDLFAKSVIAVLESMDIQDVHIIGHSLGHPISKRVAELIPETIVSLCIVDGVYFDFPEEEEEKKRYIQNLSDFVSMFSGENINLDAFINSLFISSTPIEVKEYTSSTMMQTDDFVGRNTMENLILEENWIKTKVELPTLAIYANIPELPDNNDSILMDWYPKLEYKELDDVGHFLMMEGYDEFNRLLDEFIVSK